MILGVDASNISSGGGLTHLVELMRAAKPEHFDFSEVVIWAPRATLDVLEDRPWLRKISDQILEKNYLWRTYWQRFSVGKLAEETGCNLLFAPGGTYASNLRPVVTMSQNLLPFEGKEMRRYVASPKTFLRLSLLRFYQAHSFRSADGTIFLTGYAREVIERAIGGFFGNTAIIPHGIDQRFFLAPRPQLDIRQYSKDKPFRMVYVSAIASYKHQWHVATAVAQLRAEGLPVVLDLVGPASPSDLRRLRDTLQSVDPDGTCVNYLGPMPYREIHAFYGAADLCIFASSCENLPNILLEGMASGLPIACSSRGPMPEVLNDGGVYFDPEDSGSIASAIRQLTISSDLRTRKASVSFEIARQYSWQTCADRTFEFLSDVASRYSQNTYRHGLLC